MLREALEWMLTPAPMVARRMGHLAEGIAIRARHRRCRAAWAAHQTHTRAALLDAVERDTRPERRRTALVLGSGPLLDIPLAELAARFASVWLVDLVHPWTARWQARRFGNVRRITHDVSECLQTWIDQDAPVRIPSRFLDEPSIDWVASVNLVSQLSHLPARWLIRRGRLDAMQAAGLAQAMIEAHLAWLNAFSAPVCLVADLVQTEVDAKGEIVELADFRALFQGWESAREWRWDIAPRGELAGGGHAWHSVAALRKPGQPGTLHSICPV